MPPHEIDPRIVLSRLIALFRRRVSPRLTSLYSHPVTSAHRRLSAVEPAHVGTLPHLYARDVTQVFAEANVEPAICRPFDDASPDQFSR